MPTRTHLALAAGFVLLLASSCEGTAGQQFLSDSGTCTNPSGCPNGQDGSVDGSIQFDAGGLRIERLAVTPAVVTLDSTASAPMPTQQFTAELVLEDASRRPVQFVNWSLSGPRVGTVDAGGLFMANGVSGGRATLTASVNVNGTVFTAPAAVVVKLERTVVGAGFNREDISKFDGPVSTGPGTPSVLYPRHGVVMPQNVAPADIQWDAGTFGDLYEVTVTKPNTSVVAYFRHGAGFTRHWLVEADPWKTIATSDGEAPATISVRRYEAATGRVLESSPVDMIFADAVLAGSVYYWNVGTQSLRRINDSQTTNSNLIPSPQTGCVGCHAISTSGRYISARLSHSTGAVFDLTADLTENPAPTVYPAFTPGSPNWFGSSWSPDDTRMAIVINSTHSGRALSIIDPFSGDSVAVTGALPDRDAHNPAWAPDNSAILYTANVAIQIHAENQISGDLALLPITGPDSVGAPQIIHVGASLEGNPAGASDTYPTWSPDSGKIAFAHGTGSASVGANVAALYMIGRDGSNLVRLDAANGSNVQNFQPHFSPFQQGGYYWLGFLSRRAYGSPAVGHGGNIPQIWISAVRTDAAPGQDPSAPAYWLPGQNPRSQNISVRWAPQACRANGESCRNDSECCTERCNTSGVCEAPPEAECRERGFTCAENSDCCGTLVCSARACSEPLI